jgi:membrane protease YdiL (CAAX protease family)
LLLAFKRVPPVLAVGLPKEGAKRVEHPLQPRFPFPDQGFPTTSQLGPPRTLIVLGGLVAVLFVVISLDYGTGGNRLLGFLTFVLQLFLFGMGLWLNQASLQEALAWHLLGLYAVLGVILGYGLYVLSSLVTQVTPKEILAYFRDGRGFLRFYRERPGVLLQYLFMAFFEEVLWRKMIQGELSLMFESLPLGLGVAAAFFTLMHFRYFTELPVRWAEFFVFSLILGVLYALSGSLFLVTLVHFLRNLHVTYFGYWDEQQAQAEPS